jgi:hypothetical protein
MFLLFAGCLLPVPFTDESEYVEPLSCGGDMEAFCEHEFGRACPSLDEARGWTCDGWQLSPSPDGGGTAPEVYGRDDEGCYAGEVICRGSVDGESHYTSMDFTSDGSVQSLHTDWPEGVECEGRYYWGEPIC